MQVRAIKLVDEHFKDAISAPQGVWDYDEFLKPTSRAYFDGWISFDCLLADDKRDVVWVGLARMNADIFHVFDRRTRKFKSMNYRKVGDRYDAKFHRSLLFDADGKIWAATALLHEIDRFMEAPGGAIVRFDPDTKVLNVVGRPLPHHYIQSIEIDRKRGLLYGQTYCPEVFFAYDMKSGAVRELGPISSGIGLSQAEQLSIDRNGTVWGQWGVGRAWANAPGPTQFRLWSYHPDEKKPRYRKIGCPRLDGGAGFARIDGTVTGPDGAVYVGTVEGLLCRIDPDREKIEAIGKPAPGVRMAGMACGPDGKLWGTTGRFGHANLFSYDPRGGKLEHVGPIFDDSIGVQAYQIHNLAIMADGTIYAGENDVPTRSSYLWEIRGACRPKGHAGAKKR